MENSIVKKVILKAPLSKVWKAISDYRQFGEWFRVKLDGPFVAGQTASGNILHPGYEHLRWNVDVLKIEPETYFSFHWHPYAVDPKVDYSKETPTLVEFNLKAIDGGTELTLTESGFENVPGHRRLEAFRMNEGGWTEQMKNVGQYLAQHA